VEITITFSSKGVQWTDIALLLKSVGMASYAPELHQKAFESSFTAVFVYDQETLVGCGRVLSDGAYQAAIYDVAISEKYQGAGIGRAIIEALEGKVKGCNIVLYAAIGKDAFYRKLGYRRMLTGMAKFTSQESMADKGFTD